MDYETIKEASDFLDKYCVTPEEEARKEYMEKINVAVNQAMEKYKNTLIRLASR